MDTRQLGRTGVEVSPLCLGAMMFGAWGNEDHEDSIRTIGAARSAAQEWGAAQGRTGGGGSERLGCGAPLCSLLVRAGEAAVLPACARWGMGAVPWSPRGGGRSPGPYGKGEDLVRSRR